MATINLDNFPFVITTQDTDGWYLQDTVVYSGTPTLKSGNITANQSTVASFVAQGCGVLTLYYKVSSESADRFNLQLVDGIKANVTAVNTGGYLDWTMYQQEISVDTTVTLTYSKDPTVNSLLDSAFVGALSWHDFGYLTLASGTNNNELVWTTTSWYVEDSVLYDGHAALRNKRITNNQSCEIHTTVNGLSLVSFVSKISSEANCDFLKFYIAGNLYFSQSGTVDWATSTFWIGTPGSTTLSWTYSKDGSIDAGSDAAWITNVTCTPVVISLADVAKKDQAISNWTTGVDTFAWFPQGTTTHSPQYFSLRSGPITDRQSCSLTATVSGTGTLSFYYFVRSETNCDFIQFYINGTQQVSRSGLDSAWTFFTYNITTTGESTLNWTYSKDSSISQDLDSGFVSEVLWIPDFNIVSIATTAPSSINSGDAYEIVATATWTDNSQTIVYPDWATTTTSESITATTIYTYGGTSHNLSVVILINNTGDMGGITSYNILYSTSNDFNTVWCDPKASLTSGRFYIARPEDITIINNISGQPFIEDYYSLTSKGTTGEVLTSSNITNVYVTY